MTPEPIASTFEGRAPVFLLSQLKASIPSLAHIFAPEKAPVVDIGVEHELETKYHVRFVPKDLFEKAVDIKDMAQVYMRVLRKEGEKHKKARVRVFSGHGKHIKLSPTYRLLRKKNVSEKAAPQWLATVWQRFFPDQPMPTQGDIEIYTDINAQEAQAFSTFASGDWVAKTRFYIPHTAIADPSRTCTVHFDVFRAIGNTSVQYIIAEIEYNTKDDEVYFAEHTNELPDWLGASINDETNPEYKSSYISEHKKTPPQDTQNISGLDTLYERLNSEPFLEQAFGEGATLTTANPF